MHPCLSYSYDSKKCVVNLLKFWNSEMKIRFRNSIKLYLICRTYGYQNVDRFNHHDPLSSWCSISARMARTLRSIEVASSAMISEASQGKTSLSPWQLEWQDKTSQAKPRQDKTKQARQDETRHDLYGFQSHVASIVRTAKERFGPPRPGPSDDPHLHLENGGRAK